MKFSLRRIYWKQLIHSSQKIILKVINNFQDHFFTTMNRLCPIDCKKDKHDPSTFFNYETANALHPCSLDPKNF